jgi:excisionase family DNA binding protein
MASTAQAIPAKLLRVPQVAEICDVAEKTVWNWIYSKDLPSIILGRSRRVSVESLQEFIEAGARKSA